MQRLHGYPQRCSRWTQKNISTRLFGFQLLWTRPFLGLFGIILLSKFTVESVLARTGTVELPHNKAVFLNKIKDGFIFVRYPLEPLVLVNVALDNVNLSIQDIMKMFAFVEHGQTVSVFVKSIAFLDSYGNRHEREAVQSFLPSAWKGFLAVIAETKEI
jgi:hypothetical protein